MLMIINDDDDDDYLLPDDSVKLLRQTLDKVPGVRLPAGLLYLLISRVLSPKLDVIPDGGREQDRLLANQSSVLYYLTNQSSPGPPRRSGPSASRC